MGKPRSTWDAKYDRTIGKRYVHAVRRARIGKIKWALTHKQYENIITPNVCDYCQRTLDPTGSGLDRINNDKGYTIKNTVASCGQCNQIKSNHLSYIEAKTVLGALAGMRLACGQDSRRFKWPEKRQYSSAYIVCGVKYHLRFVRKIPVQEEDLDIDLWGECDGDEKVILVKLGQSPKNRFMTVFHELLHAYEFETKIELGEKTVRIIEQWVGMLLTDNF